MPAGNAAKPQPKDPGGTRGDSGPVRSVSHPSLRFEALRGASDWASWSYDEDVPLEVLEAIEERGYLDVALPGPRPDGSDAAEPMAWYPTAEEGRVEWRLRVRGFRVTVRDPRKVARLNIRDRVKFERGKTGPVRIEAQGWALTMLGPEYVRRVRDAFERALWNREVPEHRRPTMRHLAVDIEVCGRERESGSFVRRFFASADQVQRDWRKALRLSRVVASFPDQDAVDEANEEPQLDLDFCATASSASMSRTLYLGSRSLALCRVYEKGKQLSRLPLEERDELLEEWRAAGCVEPKNVLRVEFSCAREWMRKQKVVGGEYLTDMLGDDIEQHLDAIWQTLTTRNEWVPGSGKKDRRSVHPFWRVVQRATAMFRHEARIGMEPVDLVRQDRERDFRERFLRIRNQAAALARQAGVPLSALVLTLQDHARVNHDEVEEFIRRNGYDILVAEQDAQRAGGYEVGADVAYAILRDEVGRARTLPTASSGSISPWWLTPRYIAEHNEDWERRMQRRRVVAEQEAAAREDLDSLAAERLKRWMDDQAQVA